MLQVQSTVLRRASASEAEGPQALTALCAQGQVPWSTVAEMPNAELSLPFSAFGQTLKLQLLEG